VYTVAYLECAKGGAPGGLGNEKADAFLSLFCYWMPTVWCFRRRKINKTAKNTII